MCCNLFEDLIAECRGSVDYTYSKVRLEIKY